MKNSKLKLYEIAVKWRSIFYLIAVLIFIIPISIVVMTGDTFNFLSGDAFIDTALLFIIIGKILTEYKNTIENGAVNWFSIGGITGFLIGFIWNIFK